LWLLFFVTFFFGQKKVSNSKGHNDILQQLLAEKIPATEKAENFALKNQK
jgi:hypothetical protein